MDFKGTNEINIGRNEARGALGAIPQKVIIVIGCYVFETYITDTCSAPEVIYYIRLLGF